MATSVPGVHTSSAALEAAMDAAWAAVERYEAAGWIFRAADGVTQRANSIWPRRDPDGGAPGFPVLLREARSWYRSRRLPVIFQLFDDARTASLNTFLDAEGFTRQSETLILTRVALPVAAPPGNPVELAPQPSDEWLQVWWDVDGRGGAKALATARQILEGCPSVYALVRGDDGQAAAVGRLALPEGTAGPLGGIYCMATHPDARRHGFGTDVLRALLQEGASRKLDGYWLLVTAANHGARELYAKAGFREEGRYLYRQERPRRARTGC